MIALLDGELIVKRLVIPRLKTGVTVRESRLPSHRTGLRTESGCLGSRHRSGAPFAMKPVIALCDANAFYCSCEQVFDPSLRNRPLGVLSNNDGCIISRTSELKALGVAMGTPAFKVRHLLERGEIVLRSSNYPLYGDMSSRFMSVLEQFTPALEVYSIDEAFLDLTGLPDEKLESIGQGHESKG